MKTPFVILLAAACSLSALTGAPAPTQAKSVSQLAGELRREVAIAQAETAEAKKNVSRLKGEISDAFSWGLQQQKDKEAAQADAKKLADRLKKRQLGAGVVGFILAVVVFAAAGIFFNRRQEAAVVTVGGTQWDTPKPPDIGSGPAEPATPSLGEVGGKKKSRTARRSVPTK